MQVALEECNKRMWSRECKQVHTPNTEKNSFSNTAIPTVNCKDWSQGISTLSKSRCRNTDTLTACTCTDALIRVFIAMMVTLLIAISSPFSRTNVPDVAVVAAAPPLHHEPELSHILTETQSHK